jgi:hypothetical protein
MRPFSRRSLLATLGASLPFGLGGARAAFPPADAPTRLRFRPFEAAVREAFAAGTGDDPRRGRVVEVGDCDLVRAGVQGCHNARPFAGFPAGGLRIVRTASAPGPASGGVRLYVTTVEILPASAAPGDAPTRPLDFAALPPAPTLA